MNRPTPSISTLRLRSLVAPLPQEPEDGDDLWGAIMGSSNDTRGTESSFRDGPRSALGGDGSLRPLEADSGSRAAPQMGDGSGAGPDPRGRVPVPSRVRSRRTIQSRRIVVTRGRLVVVPPAGVAGKPGRHASRRKLTTPNSTRPPDTNWKRWATSSEVKTAG